MTSVNRSPAAVNDLSHDALNTKRSADPKSKKKPLKEIVNGHQSNRSNSIKKPTIVPPLNRNILLERLNTDRSINPKPSSREYSRSKMNSDLFKSIKTTDNTLKKKIKKMVFNHRQKSDKKLI